MTNDLVQEYLHEYTIFMINQETNEQLFQLECGFLNESMGLISLNEALVDTLGEWFKKIVEETSGVIDKLENKLTGLFNTQLAKFEKIANSPEKTNPESLGIPITNYHEYDFTKFRDGTYDANKAFTNPEYIKVVAGVVGGNGEKPESLDKKSIIKTLYPSLYDDNLSIFDKMKQGVVTTGKDTNQETILNMEMVENAWEYVKEGYITLIRKVKEDKDFIVAQKKNIDAAVQQLSNIVQAQGAPKQQEQTQESFVFCEEYLLEAPTTPQADKPVKDQKIEDGKGGVSKEVYIKAIMSYITVAVDVISAKVKVINTAFMDKLRILVYYFKHAK